MKSEKFVGLNLDSINEHEEIFTGEADEEVLSCEGGPCNFVSKHIEE